MAKWRLKLDVPYRFAIEKGFRYEKFAADFREKDIAANSVFRCPVTKMLMLNPSYRNRDFNTDFKGFDEWRKEADAWKSIQRVAGETQLSFMTHAVRHDDPTYFEILTDYAITKRAADALKYDDLIWALESNFFLEIDEGFAVHYHGLTDEMARKENWFLVQWDNIGLHFSQSGRVRVVRYNRESPATDAVFVEEFQIADAGELLNRHGYFVFIPIPFWGLAIYHSTAQRSPSLFSGNATSQAVRGAYLIDGFPTREVDGYGRIFERSLVRFALNPRFSNMLGYQSVSYPASATFTDVPFRVPYKPSQDGTTLSNLAVNTIGGSVAMVLRNNADDADWSHLTDTDARMKLTLTAGTGGKRTPFVYAYEAYWEPIFATRATSEVVFDADGVDLLWDWEYTEDERGYFEGKVQIKAESAEAIKIVERGDTTFALEYSLNGGTDWLTAGGGLAKLVPSDTVLHKEGGLWYEATFDINGFEEQLSESNFSDSTKFDGSTCAGAINLILTSHCFEPIADADFPALALSRELPRVPTGEKHFRFGLRAGDDGKKALEKVLLFLSVQNRDYLCNYNFAAKKWQVVAKPNLSELTEWFLSPDDEDRDEANRIGVYVECAPEFEPPEGNVLVVVGLSSTDVEKAQRVESLPIVNNASFDDPDSLEYLGRVKMVIVEAIPLSDQEEVDIMARKLYPRMAKHLTKLKVKLTPGRLCSSLSPNIGVTVTKPGGDTYPQMFVKLRTVEGKRDENGMTENERVTLHLSQQYETEIRS